MAGSQGEGRGAVSFLRAIEWGRNQFCNGLSKKEKIGKGGGMGGGGMVFNLLGNRVEYTCRFCARLKIYGHFPKLPMWKKQSSGGNRTACLPHQFSKFQTLFQPVAT